MQKETVMKNVAKKAAAAVLSASLLVCMTPLSALAADGDGPAFKTWKDLYAGMGITTSQEGEGYYDAVTSATQIGANHHVGHIPSVVQKEATGEKIEGTDVDALKLTGVNITGAETKDTVLAQAAHVTFEGKTPNKTYGSDEFTIALDYTGMDYTWNDYLDKIYAVTVSDGETTVGAVPWIDWYGEKKTAGPHYNKVEVALNSGVVVADNKATVHRFDAFYDNGQLKSGKYTVTVYAEGFKPLTASNIWVAAKSNVKPSFSDAAATSVKMAFDKDLPADFQPVYTVDGNAASYAEGVLTFDQVKPGSHSVQIACGNKDADGNPKYDAVNGSFVYTVTEDAVAFNIETKMLEAVGSDITVADFVGQITEVSVNGTPYKPSGKGQNIVKVINEDGSIDLSKTTAADAAEDVQITVTATGYPVFTFTYPVKAEEPQDPVDEKQIDIAGAAVTVPAVTYTGKALTPAVTVKLGGKTLVKGTDFDAAYSNNKNAGKASVKITGKGAYTGTKTAAFTINKAAQKMTVKAAVKKVKLKKVRRKKQVVSKVFAVKNAKGAVSYKTVKFANKKSKKALKVNAKTGKITVKKGTKKGVYKMTVAVTAKGDKNYKVITKKVAVTVKVVR